MPATRDRFRVRLLLTRANVVSVRSSDGAAWAKVGWDDPRYERFAASGACWLNMAIGPGPNPTVTASYETESGEGRSVQIPGTCIIEVDGLLIAEMGVIRDD